LPPFLRSKLKMEAVGCSEALLLIYRTTLLHTREDYNFNNHSCENQEIQDCCVLSVGFSLEIKLPN
jgi:hypothetical protein